MSLAIALLTVSDTRTLADDHSGDALRQRLEAASQRRQEGWPTLPGSLAEERATNLFLRAENAAALAELRASRNAWTG